MPEVRPTHRWRLPSPPDGNVSTLSRELELPQLVVDLLLRRGYSTADDIRAFLDPSPARLRKPDLLPDIVPATERVIDAIKRRERILIYGDYDVDGVTGTVRWFPYLAGSAQTSSTTCRAARPKATASPLRACDSQSNRARS